MKYKLLMLNLRLFDEGGAPAGPSASESVESGAPQAGKKGEPVVLYGKQDNEPVGQDPSAGVEETKPQTEEKPVIDRKAEFEKLIKGDYKEYFHEKTQSIIDQRFKQSKQLEQQLQQVNPLLEMVASKYNVDPSNVEALTKAIQNDNEYWEAAAEEAGMTVEQYQYMKKIEQDNAQFKRQQAEIQRQEHADRVYNGWMQEAELMKAEYPEFDLRTEMENPKFISLLQSNVGVEHAYKVIHMNDIVNNKAAQAAKQAEANVTNSIRVNGQRPKEAGTRSQSGVIVKSDPSQWTKEDRLRAIQENKRGNPVKL